MSPPRSCGPKMASCCPTYLVHTVLMWHCACTDFVHRMQRRPPPNLGASLLALWRLKDDSLMKVFCLVLVSILYYVVKALSVTILHGHEKLPKYKRSYTSVAPSCLKNSSTLSLFKLSMRVTRLSACKQFVDSKSASSAVDSSLSKSRLMLLSCRCMSFDKIVFKYHIKQRRIHCVYCQRYTCFSH